MNIIPILILFIGFYALAYLFCRLIIAPRICPDCHDSERYDPCEVCGGKGTISRGHNPCLTAKGNDNLGQSTNRIGRTHGKGWWNDRGSKGLIS